MKLLPLTLLLASLIIPTNCFAKSPGLPKESSVRAILGEAEGESYAGKVALAYALKNRGKLAGVYGHKAVSKRFKGYYRGDRRLNEKVVKEAQKAWEWANSYPALDPTHGAKHWENIKAYGVPYWARGHKPSVVIGNHAFYVGIK